MIKNIFSSRPTLDDLLDSNDVFVEVSTKYLWLMSRISIFNFLFQELICILIDLNLQQEEDVGNYSILFL